MRPESMIAISALDVPPGAIGMCVTQGAIGRIIAHRQGGIPYSHVVLATGRGEMVHAPWPWVAHERITRWRDREIDWWAPREPLTEQEVDDLRSMAHAWHDRVHYSLLALLEFLIHGYPRRRGHGVYCSQLVAEFYLSSRRRYDFTGVRKPWQCAPREIMARLATEDWRYIGTTGIGGS